MPRIVFAPAKDLALLALAAGAVACAVAVFAGSRAPDAAPQSLEALKAAYRRPATLPVPADNPLTPQKVELGWRLFGDKRLSADGTIACATCHDPSLAFADGVEKGRGIAKVPLARHTPALWNLAWTPALYWDGRAASLEAQARFPIEHPKEMGQPLAEGAARLRADPDYAPLFAAAFPATPEASETTILQALASYERTLVSPPTRFDAWVAGDNAALSEDEIAGFRLFNGRAGCSVCHSGWSFTDHGFHDIGLRTDDLGRGPIIGLNGVNRAFKTPGLRELTWTAPYMHDGSIATLDDVLRHYERGGVGRPTRSTDLPRSLSLSGRERDDLIAFLETLSSSRPPRPMPIDGLPQAGPATHDAAVATASVAQKDKLFNPGAVTVARGTTLAIVNDDKRPHNVRIFDPRLSFNSGLQEPGDVARVTLPDAGIFEAFCGIHPSMRLRIEVK